MQAMNPPKIIDRRLLLAVAASLIIHTLLLIASPGKLLLDLGGSNKRIGDSPQGNLTLRLLTPAANKKLPPLDFNDPLGLPAPALNAADTAPANMLAVPTPQSAAASESESSTTEATRGEPVVTNQTPADTNNARAGLPFMPAERYYAVAELDVRPQVKVTPEFGYPETAVANRMTGKVIVTLLLDESGRVEDVKVIGSDPPGVFDEAAIVGWRRARFTPGLKTETAVKSRLTLEVNFDASHANPSRIGGQRGRY